MRFEHGLVAGADLIGEAQLAVAAAGQKRKGQGPALAADRDRPARLPCGSSGRRGSWNTGLKVATTAAAG